MERGHRNLSSHLSPRKRAPTKKKTLNKVAKVYDALVRASPTTLEGKFLDCNASQEKKAWDAELPQKLVKHRKK